MRNKSALQKERFYLKGLLGEGWGRGRCGRIMVIGRGNSDHKICVSQGLGKEGFLFHREKARKVEVWNAG